MRVGKHLLLQAGKLTDERFWVGNSALEEGELLLGMWMEVNVKRKGERVENPALWGAGSRMRVVFGEQFSITSHVQLPDPLTMYVYNFGENT